MLDPWISTGIAVFLSALLANEILMRRARRQLTPLMRATLPRFERQWAGGTRWRMAPVAIIALTTLAPGLLTLNGWLPILNHPFGVLLPGTGSVLLLVLAFLSARVQQKAAGFPDDYLASSRRSFAIVVLGLCTMFLMMVASSVGQSHHPAAIAPVCPSPTTVIRSAA
jgi:hypothetical protein